MKYKIVYSLVIATLAFVGMSLLNAPSAKAALEGENGRVLYIDETNQQPTLLNNCIEICEEVPQTENVVTTAPDGTGDVVAATSEDDVTAASISNPTDTGNHDIVYAVESPDCTAVPVDNVEDVRTLVKCRGTEASLSKVTIDKDGNPLADPTELVTFDPLFKNGTTEDSVYNISYAPDSQSVLVSRYSELLKDTSNTYRAALEIVDTNTGDVTTIVKAACDYNLRGGYGTDGAIYYSKSAKASKDCEDARQSDIWYIPTGTTEAVRLTQKNNDISEYYIDASPDNTELLVVDSSSCDYRYYATFGWMGPLPGCDYYYVSVADGTLTPITDMSSTKLNQMFVPKFFSPDGTSLIGTLYPYRDDSLARLFSLDESLASTAVVARTDLANPVAISNIVGVQEWAPKFVAAVPNVPTTPTPTTSATLPNTGANSLAVLAFAAALVALGGASLATSRRR